MLVNKKALPIDEMIGKTVGNYKITEEIGSGGMGRVYKAIHLTLNRLVAVKMIHLNLVSNLEVMKRFYKEAKIQARLNHPNIVAVYDFLETGGNYFIIMEYVHGESIGKIVSEHGPFEPYIALSIFKQILVGIRYAHSNGVIHRDIKLNNFILTPTVVKITDFGVAQIIGDTGLTATGAVLGTPKYMSPEQILGNKIDHRTDIYSLGATFYEMLAGRAPFDSDSDYEIKRGHVELPPPSVTQIKPDIPREFENIVLRALLKKPEERFQSVDEFIMALENIDRRKGEVIIKKREDSLNLSNIHPIERPGGAENSLENPAPQEERFDEKGDLNITPYPTLLLSFHREKRTGFLALDSWTKLKIYFLEGFIVFVEGGDSRLALGEMLIDREKITKVDQEKALGFAHETGLKIGEALIKMGKITPYELNSFLEIQTGEKLTRGFQCKSGSYEFKSTRDFIEKAMYKIDPIQVIYEGVNRFIEKGETLKLLYERDSSMIPSPDIKREIKDLVFSPKELRLVKLLTKGLTLEEAIVNSPLNIDDTLKFLYFLELVELVEIRSERAEFREKKQDEKGSASTSEEAEVVNGLKTKKLEQADIKTPSREREAQEPLKKKFFR